MGVEPTWDRLTAPPGFEVRSLHRERDSSISIWRLWRKEFDARRIDAAEILPTDREPVTIKEFQNLDSHLTAVLQAIAEFRCREFAAGRFFRNVDRDLRHLLHG